jgi:diadenosine tetraphosphatase ApaH/serine/threonine PP2A family protein phosphatase
MRYAIISDIHGNMDALEAVCEDIRNVGVDRYVSCGDLVGYGAEPGRCIEQVKELAVEGVIGNHDSAVTGGTPVSYFNSYAREAVLWTIGHLDEDAKKYLAGLPLARNYDGFSITHASFHKPHTWRYVLDEHEARKCLDAMPETLCFIGHSHVPLVVEETGLGFFSGSREVDIREGRRYIINVGSVGQPRDADPRASYAVYDDDARRVSIRRVRYDVEGAARKIRAAGLPEILAERLGRGR